MRTNPALTLIILIASFCSCKEYAFFQSPLHPNTSAYRSVPLASDTTKSAFYVNGTFLTGGANHNFRDGTNGFTGAIYRSHQFGNFNGYYGLTTTLGDYNIKKYDTAHYRPGSLNNYFYNSNLDAVAINSMAGHKFFGGVGGIGGISLVLPFKRGGEWRVIQVEGNWQREFGDYLTFRTKLPD